MYYEYTEANRSKIGWILTELRPFKDIAQNSMFQKWWFSRADNSKTKSKFENRKITSFCQFILLYADVLLLAVSIAVKEKKMFKHKRGQNAQIWLDFHILIFKSKTNLSHLVDINIKVVEHT